jgi:hypothetical protein
VPIFEVLSFHLEREYLVTEGEVKNTENKKKYSNRMKVRPRYARRAQVDSEND